jgi:hypothetical protein
LIGTFCLTLLILPLLLETSLTCQGAAPSDNVSGEYYDWTATLKPVNGSLNENVIFMTVLAIWLCGAWKKSSGPLENLVN